MPRTGLEDVLREAAAERPAGLPDGFIGGTCGTLATAKARTTIPETSIFAMFVTGFGRWPCLRWPAAQSSIDGTQPTRDPRRLDRRPSQRRGPAGSADWNRSG